MVYAILFRMTEDKKFKERGKRLWKNYRWTNEMYDELLRLQNGKCAVCHQPPKEGGMRLVVDHYHFKIRAQRSQNSGWLAGCIELDARVWWGKTKVEAIAVAKNALLPLSVRGLLCPGRHGKAGHGSCNRLIGRIDNLPWLREVIHYLENPPAKILLDKPTPPVVAL